MRFSSSWSASAYVIIDPHNNPVRKESAGEDVVVVVQLPSHVWLFATPRTAACQASLSLTISQSLPNPMDCSMPGLPIPNHISESAQPHGLKHARLPCPSPCPRLCPSSCPLSWWCYPTMRTQILRERKQLALGHLAGTECEMRLEWGSSDVIPGYFSPS